MLSNTLNNVRLQKFPGKVHRPDKTKNSIACGFNIAWALALAHAKSGDAAMISGYAGKSDELDEAMVRFAFAYADQTEKDHRALVDAARSGRIKVASAES